MAVAMGLRAGQELAPKWRTAQSVVLENLKRFKLVPTLNGGREVPCYVTFVDAVGVSVYLVRGFHLGGDMEAFLPAAETQWSAYFEPLSAINGSYVRSRHFARIFPRQFVQR